MADRQLGVLLRARAQGRSRADASPCGPDLVSPLPDSVTGYRPFSCFRLAVYAALLSFVAWLPVPAAADAAGTVCAVVEIEIEQELTLERQAFDARLRVVNGLESVALEDFTVDVLFEDAQGNAVQATSDPNDTEASFFIRVDELNNIDSVDGGTIQGGAEATMHWLIVPSPGTADGDPNGTLYMVGAELSYNYAGESEEITVTPDTIRVKPMPALTLDYFLPRDVHANDPLTDTVEPAIPFTLGVRVNNSGQGEARNLAIESAQPEIVDNELGLAIDFRIIDSQVGNEMREPNLNLDFGTIPSGEARIGRWRMETSLSGRFVDFDARYTHADEFGGELTSLLDDVRTHELVGDVLVDLPGRDNVRDFLAHDDAYNALRVFESSGVDSPVSDHSDVAVLDVVAHSGETAVVTVEIPPSAGFAYARLEDPFDNAMRVSQVTREDGKRLPHENVWIEQAYLSGGERASWLHLFDVNSPGRYTVELGAFALDAGNPIIQFIPDKVTHEGGQLGFLVEAGDAAGNIPSLEMQGPDRDESFEDHGDGSGTFLWSPVEGDAGDYTLTFRAHHGGATGRRDVDVQVNPAHDTDGDGMDDAWEEEYFGHLERDGTGDYSGDGISDRMAFERGLDPTLAYNVDDFRAAPGTVIIDDAWREVAYLREFQAPVVIASPASLNDPEPGVVQVDAASHEHFRIRFARWPHLEDSHGLETASYLMADPGSYFIDVDGDDIMIEVGTFELDAAGSWTQQSFSGDFPDAPTVLTTIQRNGHEGRVFTTRVEGVDAQGFTVGAFAEAADLDAAADLTVGYLAMHDAGRSGDLPLVDSDAPYERLRTSVSGDAVEVHGEPLRFQTDASQGGDGGYTRSETVEGLAFGEHIFAQSQSAARAAAVTLRSGPLGGEEPQFNFARPGQVVAAADGEVTLEIVRSGNTADESRIEVRTVAGSAVAARDFEAIEQELVFASAQTLETVTIDLVEGGNDSPSQAFEVVLTPVDEAVRTVFPETTLVTVVDGAVTDSNNSGMADVWEAHYFGGIGVEPGSSDYDGDGVNNRRSFLRGLDPTAGPVESTWLSWNPRAVIDDDWQELTLAGAGDDTVVIAGTVTDYGDAPGVVRLRQTGEALEGRFARWDGAGHGLEAVALLGVAPGRHTLGGDTWEAGSSATGDGAWQRVSFTEAFAHAPHVLVTPQASSQAVATRVRNIDADGFEVALVNGAGERVAGEAGWLAIGGAVAAGTVNIDDTMHDYRIERTALDDQISEIMSAHLGLEDPAAGALSLELTDVLVLEDSSFAQVVTSPEDPAPLAVRRSVARDADHDGLPDRWELAMGLDPDDPHDALSDPHGEGFSMLAEYVAGTDPRDAGDTPQAANIRLRAPLISSWPTPVEFGGAYDHPVVIAGAATDYDPDPGVVRLNFVGEDRVHAWFQEWNYLDGLHGRERAPLMVLEAGRHLVGERQVWEADTVEVSGARDWTPVTFAAAHDFVPQVVVTAQTAHGSLAVTARVRNVTTEGFEVALFGERGEDDSAVAGQTVGFVAASPVDRYDFDTAGYVDMDGHSLRYRLEQADVTHEETHFGRARLQVQSEQSQGNGAARDAETVDVIRFDGAVFAQDVSYNDATPGVVRRVTAASDDEVTLSEGFAVLHGLDPGNPDVGALDASGDGFSILEEYVALTDIFSADDSPVRPKIRAHTLSAGDQWTPIAFADYYARPVVIAGAASAHDPSPGVVRIRDVERVEAQVRFAGWDYLAAVRTQPEEVALLVLDAGRHLVDGNQIWEVDTVDVDAANAWTEVEFRRAHASVPRVLVTTQTANSDAPVVARVRNVTESGFEVAVFAEQAGDPAHYSGERVGFVAASGATEAGSISWDGVGHEVGFRQIGLDHEPTAIEGVHLHLQEEQSATPGTEHAEELVDVLILDASVFAQDVSFQDADPAVVRQVLPEAGN